jgi:hypothetical protein
MTEEGWHTFKAQAPKFPSVMTVGEEEGGWGFSSLIL